MYKIIKIVRLGCIISKKTIVLRVIIGDESGVKLDDRFSLKNFLAANLPMAPHELPVAKMMELSPLTLRFNRVLKFVDCLK